MEDESLVVTWRRLLTWAAWAAVIEYVAVSVIAQEVIPPVIVIGVVIAVGAFLLRRPGNAGVIVTLVGLALFFLSNLAFALGDLSEYRSFPSFTIASAAFVSGAVGLVAAIATLRRDGESHVARTITLGATAAIVGLLAVNAIGTIAYDDAKTHFGDIVLTADDITFSTTQISTKAGPVSFFVKNKDAVLHNLHVKGVGTLSLPAGHSARKTFTIVAGTYEYVCDYHADDMKGTLTVT